MRPRWYSSTLSTIATLPQEGAGPRQLSKASASISVDDPSEGTTSTAVCIDRVHCFFHHVVLSHADVLSSLGRREPDTETSGFVGGRGNPSALYTARSLAGVVSGFLPSWVCYLPYFLIIAPPTRNTSRGVQCRVAGRECTTVSRGVERALFRDHGPPWVFWTRALL